MEVPRVGVKLELQLPAYTTATATLHPSHGGDQHHILMDTSWICFRYTTTETPIKYFLM